MSHCHTTQANAQSSSTPFAGWTDALVFTSLPPNNRRHTGKRPTIPSRKRVCASLAPSAARQQPQRNCTLPPELLIEIYSHHVHQLEGNPWVLAQVCRDWRFTALRSGALWTRIYIIPALSVSTWAHQSPRQRYLDGRQRCFTEGQLQETIIMSKNASIDIRARLPPRFQMPESTVAKRFWVMMDIVGGKVTERWKAFELVDANEVDAFYEDVIETDDWARYFEQPGVAFKKLRQASMSLNPIDLLGVASKSRLLKTLSLELKIDIHRDFVHHYSFPSTLDTLKANAYFDSWVYVAVQMPIKTLYLKLTNMKATHGFEEITLVNLTSLTLEGHGAVIDSTRLSCPRLESLEIRNVFNTMDAFEGLVGVLKRDLQQDSKGSRLAPLYLKLDDIKIKSAPLMRFLEQMPSVTKLEIVDMAAPECFYRSLRGPGAQEATLLPNIKDILVDLPPQVLNWVVVEEVIVDIIERRKQAGKPLCSFKRIRPFPKDWVIDPSPDPEERKPILCIGAKFPSRHL